MKTGRCCSQAVAASILAAGIACLAVSAGRAEATPSWEALKAHYEYDRSAPLAVETSDPALGIGATEYQFTFAGADGERVPALLLVPTAGEAPFPCVLFLHGLGSKKEDARLALPLIAAGYAILALDARHHGAREATDRPLLELSLDGIAEAFIATVVDYRRAMDYLRTREDADAGRVGLVGVSMGGIMGGLLAGVDERVKTAVLVSGGGNWGELLGEGRHPAVMERRQRGLPDTSRIMEIMAPADPLHFVEHIAPRPLLMLNGRDDVIVPAVCAQQLFERAREPKEIEWYDSGHVIPIGPAVTRMVAWLEETLRISPAKKEPAASASNRNHRLATWVVWVDPSPLTPRALALATSVTSGPSPRLRESGIAKHPRCFRGDVGGDATASCDGGHNTSREDRRRDHA